MKKMTGRAALSLVLALALLCRPLFPAFAGTYDISEGSVKIHAATDTQPVRQGGGAEVEDADPVVTGSTTENTLTIIADAGAEAKVTFDSLTVTMPQSEDSREPGTAAVTMKGEGSVTVELDGDSSLTSGNFHAGLEKQNGGRLTIADDNGDDGSLAAAGGTFGAGIGSGFNLHGWSPIGNGSDIVITGGTVTATGGFFGAGIGGGYRGSGEDITISGGTVTATGGFFGAGIGGGDEGSGENITISGGPARHGPQHGRVPSRRRRKA